MRGWVLAIALLASPAAAFEGFEGYVLEGDFTIVEMVGTCDPELSAIAQNKNRFRLVLQQATVEPVSGPDIFLTRVHAARFQFAFEGPNQDLLDRLVGQRFVQGGVLPPDVFLALGGDSSHQEAELGAAPLDAAGVTFRLTADITGLIPPEGGTLLPKPFEAGRGRAELRDQRPGFDCTLADTDKATLRLARLSCDLRPAPDGGLRVTCPDGSTLDLPRSGCGLNSNGDGTFTIVCSDGNQVVIAPGGCSVTDNGDGTATIACADGSSVTVQDGRAPLFAVSDEPPGERCPSGGQRIDLGQDDDGDLVLDPEEIDRSVTVCDAENDGGDQLVVVRSEPAGPSCSNGGQRIDVGRDLDGDGALGPAEIERSSFVCNGLDGASGCESAGAQGAGLGMLPVLLGLGRLRRAKWWRRSS